jgi:hypothetical protein
VDEVYCCENEHGTHTDAQEHNAQNPCRASGAFVTSFALASATIIAWLTNAAERSCIALSTAGGSRLEPSKARLLLCAAPHPEVCREGRAVIHTTGSQRECMQIISWKHVDAVPVVAVDSDTRARMARQLALIGLQLPRLALQADVVVATDCSL